MKIGSQLPSTPVQQLADGDIHQINLADFSQEKYIVLIAVPGAFTPTCSNSHVPGYLSNMTAFKEKGVDAVVILSTSDFFVVKAWADQLRPPQDLHFMADGSQKFTQSVDHLLDLTDLGLGMRTQRYVAIIRNGEVKEFAIEQDVGSVTVTAAEEVLKKL